MNRMAARHFMRRRARIKKIFLTHGAVGLVLAVFAMMTIKQGHVDAHSTVIAMFKVFRSTYATKPTFVTVIRFLCIVHPQITDFTVVFTKFAPTFDAFVAGKMSTEKKEREGRSRYNRQITTNWSESLS